MTENERQFTPTEAIAYVQTILGGIPYTLSQQQTVGNKLSECVIILEQVKSAISSKEATNHDSSPEVSDNA